MNRELNIQERTTLINGLRVAAEQFIRNATALKADERGDFKRLAEQFERQAMESRTLADRIEQAASISIATDDECNCGEGNTTGLGHSEGCPRRGL